MINLVSDPINTSNTSKDIEVYIFFNIKIDPNYEYFNLFICVL